MLHSHPLWRPSTISNVPQAPSGLTCSAKGSWLGTEVSSGPCSESRLLSHVLCVHLASLLMAVLFPRCPLLRRLPFIVFLFSCLTVHWVSSDQVKLTCLWCFYSSLFKYHLD